LKEGDVIMEINKHPSNPPTTPSPDRQTSRTKSPSSTSGAVNGSHYLVVDESKAG
jgi:hypothetical protein